MIAFGGRILGPGEPKYLNSPETPLFDKGRTLYNLDLASPASRAANRVIVVEGYMDVIGLDRAGISEVVAPNGTALTEAQLERMWRLEPAPILCFDGDAAGQKASIRAAQRALPHLAPDKTLRFVALPAGQDPDDVVRAGGRPAIEALLAAAEPLVERLWRFEVEAAPLDTPEARAGLRQRLTDHASTIADPHVRVLYRDEWLKRFDALVRPHAGSGGGFARRTPWKKGKDGRYSPPETMPGSGMRSIGSVGIDRSTASALLTGFALFPEQAAAHIEALAHLSLADPSAAELRDRIVDLATTGEPLDRARLALILESAGAAGLVTKVQRVGAIGFSFTRSDADPERAARDLGLALETLAATGEIDAALRQATERLTAGDGEAFAEQQRLHAAREALNQRLASLAGND